jgi:hypothetical protein
VIHRVCAKHYKACGHFGSPSLRVSQMSGRHLTRSATITLHKLGVQH